MNKLFLSLLLMTNLSFGQERFENSQYEFSIQEPKGWYIAPEGYDLKNFRNIDMTDEKLSELLKNNKGTLPVVTFYKYKTNERAGLIPTVKVLLRTNRTNNLGDFKKMIIQSAQGFKEFFTDFEFISPVKEIVISDIKGYYFVGKYSMKTQSGIPMLIKSSVYCIPYKNFFYQISFMDGRVSDDCTDEFNELLESIKIGK